MNVVLDACAVIAYGRNEPGGDVVERLVTDPAVPCYVHTVNLCEIYYHYVRLAGEATARLAADGLVALGVAERNDMDRAFGQEVGRPKGTVKASLADCFAATLANRLDATVVTSDWREFGPLAAAGMCRAQFIR